jgi:hypothetical protein
VKKIQEMCGGKKRTKLMEVSVWAGRSEVCTMAAVSMPIYHEKPKCRSWHQVNNGMHNTL